MMKNDNKVKIQDRAKKEKTKSIAPQKTEQKKK
jgi:hypothetical protein